MDRPSELTEAEPGAELGHDVRPDERSSVETEPGGIPRTGDELIDAAIAELAQVRNRPLPEHIAAGESAHRLLQSRLGDLGGE